MTPKKVIMANNNDSSEPQKRTVRIIIDLKEEITMKFVKVLEE